MKNIIILITLFCASCTNRPFDCQSDKFYACHHVICLIGDDAHEEFTKAMWRGLTFLGSNRDSAMFYNGQMEAYQHMQRIIIGRTDSVRIIDAIKN